jgi:cardiolipin synthase
MLSSLDIPATTWQFYTTPKDAWQAMYDDCAHATESIEFEQYIMQNDVLGIRFMELFVEKLKAGVKVTMLCDALGSITMINSRHANLFIEEQGNIHFYHPVGIRHFRRIMQWFFRDHRKILIVDSHIAYTGGVCFMQSMENWRDTHIRITGPVVTEVQNAFRSLWNKIHHRKHRTPIHRVLHHVDGFHYYTSNPRFKKNIIYDYLLDAIINAKQYIYLTTPYFVPSSYFFRKIRQAAERGVEVILVIPHHMEFPLVYFVAESYLGKALQSGIRVFRYQKNHLHCKTIISDDNWATMGSLNLDYLSFYRNLEANLIIKDKVAIAALKQHFMQDLEESSELSYGEWCHRPLWQKILGYTGRVFKKLM